jgi:hypothetical protein
MVLFQEHMLQNAEIMPEQLAQQREMIEQQREQLGEDMYKQLTASLEANARYSALLLEAAKRLPHATPSEAAVLESYRDDLAIIMSTDEEDGYEDYEDYEDYDEQ